jgi:hypothetical protein
MMSLVVNSVGALPSGLEIVGTSPATAETTGSTVAPEPEPDMFIPPTTASPMSMAANTPANTLRTVLLIF